MQRITNYEEVDPKVFLEGEDIASRKADNISGRIMKLVRKYKAPLIGAMSLWLAVSGTGDYNSRKAYAQAPGITMSLYDDNGSPMACNVSDDTGYLGRLSVIPVNMTGKSSAKYELSNDGPLLVGWGLAEIGNSKYSISQVAMGQDAGPGYKTSVTFFKDGLNTKIAASFKAYGDPNMDPVASAGVLVPDNISNSYVLPVTYNLNSRESTGFALCNIRDVQNDYLITVFDKNGSASDNTGQPYGRFAISLPPKGHVARYLEQYASNIPREGTMQVNASYDFSMIGLNLIGTTMTTIPSVEGKLPVDVPVISIKDMLGNGSLNPDNMTKIRNGGTARLDDGKGLIYTFQINEDGNNNIRDVNNNIPALKGNYNIRVEANAGGIYNMGFAPMKWTQGYPAIPRELEMVDKRFWNSAFAERTWGTTFLYPGKNLMPDTSNIWTFYLKNDPTDTFFADKAAGLRAFMQKTVQYNIMAGGEPLGMRFVIADDVPATLRLYDDDISDYTFCALADDTLPSGAVGIPKIVGGKVKGVKLIYRRSQTPMVINSDAVALFGMEDNGITQADLAGFNMTDWDTIVIDSPRIYIPTAIDDLQIYVKKRLPECTVKGGEITLAK